MKIVDINAFNKSRNQPRNEELKRDFEYWIANKLDINKFIKPYKT